MLLMTKGVMEADNPPHSLAQKVWRKGRPFIVRLCLERARETQKGNQGLCVGDF